MIGRVLLLLCALGLSSGCALFKEIDWQAVGREVAVQGLSIAAAHNEDVAEAISKAGISGSDVRDAIDAGFAAARGDFGAVVDTGLSALERRIPGTPTGPKPEEPGNGGGPVEGLDWGVIGLAAIWAAERWKRAKERNGGGSVGGSSGKRGKAG